jgi:hypothetical protein
MSCEAKYLLFLIESEQKADPSLPLRMTESWFATAFTKDSLGLRSERADPPF